MPDWSDHGKKLWATAHWLHFMLESIHNLKGGFKPEVQPHYDASVGFSKKSREVF